MDKNRQIRFLIPPFFLLAALLWGAYLSGQLYPYLHSMDQGNDAGALKLGISILGIVGLSVVPVGFAIGVITIMTLRILGLLGLVPGRHHNYELPISDPAMERIRNLLDVSKIDLKLDLCVAAVFDHAYVKREIHDWQVRRWNAFNISAQSVISLMISILFAHALHIQIFAWGLWKWWVSIAFLIVLFLGQSVWTWLDCRKMFEFSSLAQVVLRKNSSESPPDEESNEE